MSIVIAEEIVDIASMTVDVVSVSSDGLFSAPPIKTRLLSKPSQKIVSFAAQSFPLAN